MINYHILEHLMINYHRLEHLMLNYHILEYVMINYHIWTYKPLLDPRLPACKVTGECMSVYSNYVHIW